jgi:hypothetical protein
MTSHTPRWDIDERGTGIADAAPMAGDVRRLLDHMGRGGWVTEEAHAHLGRHLRACCAEEDAEFRWLSEAQGEDGVYVVELAPVDELEGVDRVRAAIRLLACVAEASFHVREVDPATIDCVTGQLDGDGVFATHGHTIRLRLVQ